MTKYNILSYEDEPMQYAITGGHFSKEKTMSILLNKKTIDASDNLEISDICFGWGRKATEDDGIDIEPGSYMLHQGNSNIPCGYNTKITFVELVEKDNDNS